MIGIEFWTKSIDTFQMQFSQNAVWRYQVTVDISRHWGSEASIRTLDQTKKLEE